MKEIVVISGKGGTGKTSFTASCAVLGADQLVVADCDVDAADMHLLLQPEEGPAEAFFSGQKAVLDPNHCHNCGICFEVCRFDAVIPTGTVHTIDTLACEGCGYCARVCPEGAITNKPAEVGRWFRSRARTGSPMVHARLNIGADNSGKLVTRVKNEAKALADEHDRPLILVDGSPGVGCPVVSSLSGAALVVLVTEASRSGLHDLKRVHQLVKTFNLPSACILNKADLNEEARQGILDFLQEEGIALLGEFPYDESFAAAIAAGHTLVEHDTTRRADFEACWDAIKEMAGVS